jgi:hypothetical protein
MPRQGQRKASKRKDRLQTVRAGSNPNCAQTPTCAISARIWSNRHVAVFLLDAVTRLDGGKSVVLSLKNQKVHRKPIGRSDNQGRNVLGFQRSTKQLTCRANCLGKHGHVPRAGASHYQYRRLIHLYIDHVLIHIILLIRGNCEDRYRDVRISRSL